MSRVRQKYAEFAALNTQIVAISVDTPAEARKFKEGLDLPFAVVSDENRVAIEGYGTSDTQVKNNKIIARVSTVIINQQQEVIFKYVGTHWSDRPTEEKMLSIIKSLS